MHSALLRFTLLSLLSIVAVSVANAAATPQDWIVLEAAGSVEIRGTADTGLTTHAGTHLDAPFTIQTGADGHAVIAHGQDKLTLGPDTRSTIPRPTPTESGVITRISQALGTVLYQVEHRATYSFEVDTPYLVSVVKGTTFNVRVTADSSAVALIEGRVLVHTPDKKSEMILKPGQVAIKSAQSAGIILKDQQSLSSPKAGPITIANENGAQGTTAAATTDSSSTRTPTSQTANSEQTQVASISEGSNATSGLTTVTGGATVDLGTSVSGGATTPILGGTPTVDLGTGISGGSATPILGGGSTPDIGTSLTGGSTTPILGGGTPSITTLPGTDLGGLTPPIAPPPVTDVGAIIPPITLPPLL